MTEDDAGSGGESGVTPGVPDDAELNTDGMSGEEGGGDAAPGARPLDKLGDQEGWRVEDDAARVHYSGGGDRYSIEYYASSNCVLYWNVPAEESGDTAVPVDRNTLPTPLRKRIQEDLASAGIDPEIEEGTL